MINASDFGSASIRLTCWFKTAGVCKRALAGNLQQLIVGNAAPQKERQPRRELEIADPVDGSRGHVVRIALDAEDELRAGQHPLKGDLDALFEVSVAPAHLVELEQPVDIRRSRHAAIRAARKRSKGFSGRTGLLLPWSSAGRRKCVGG